MVNCLADLFQRSLIQQTSRPLPADPAPEQPILHLVQTDLEPDVDHHEKPDDLGREVEVPRQIGGSAAAPIARNYPSVLEHHKLVHLYCLG